MSRKTKEHPCTGCPLVRDALYCAAKKIKNPVIRADEGRFVVTCRPGQNSDEAHINASLTVERKWRRLGHNRPRFRLLSVTASSDLTENCPHTKKFLFWQQTVRAHLNQKIVTTTGQKRFGDI